MTQFYQRRTHINEKMGSSTARDEIDRPLCLAYINKKEDGKVLSLPGSWETQSSKLRVFKKYRLISLDIIFKKTYSESLITYVDSLHWHLYNNSIDICHPYSHHWYHILGS